MFVARSRYERQRAIIIAGLNHASQALEYRGPGVPSPAGAAGPSAATGPGAKVLILAGVAIVLLVIGILAGVNTIDVLATVLTDGLVPLIDVLAATLAGMALVRRIVPRINSALLVASGAGVGIGVLLTAGLLLGLAGWLSASTSWLLVGIFALGAFDLYFDQARWRRANVQGRRLKAESQPAEYRVPLSVFLLHPTWLWLLAAVPLGVALVGTAMPPGILWGDEPHGYDVLSYHLQIPRQWYEAGRIVPLEHNVFSHFPLGQETLSLVLMHQMGGPWKAMFAAQIMSLLLMVMATVGVFGAVAQFGSDLSSDGHRRDAPHSPAHTGLRSVSAPDAPIIAAVIFATLPWTAMLGSIAYNEPLLLLGTALCAAWAPLAPSRDWRAALLAGLFVGLGVAGKYPAVPMLGVAGGVALVLGMPWRSGAKRCAVVLIAFGGGALVFSLPWLLRNFAWTGNPFFPLATGLFGGGWDGALIERWSRAHSLAVDETRLARLIKDLILNPRYAYLLWPATLAAAALLFSRRNRRAMMLATWLAAMLVIWVFFTHLQGRFLVMAAPVAAILIGLAVNSRLRIAAIGTVLAVSIAAFVYLLPVAWQRMELGRSREMSLFGFRDLAQLTALDDPSRVGAREVYLVGDARAFLYPLPRLHYKVVFNVPAADGAMEAWLGEALATAPDNALVVIDSAEVDRLNRTYGTPLLESSLSGGGVRTMRQIREALATGEPASSRAVGEGGGE